VDSGVGHSACMCVGARTAHGANQTIRCASATWHLQRRIVVGKRIRTTAGEKKRSRVVVLCFSSAGFIRSMCSCAIPFLFFFFALLSAAAGLGPTSTRKEETEAKVEKSDGA
jgi:hypothetical protein